MNWRQGVALAVALLLGVVLASYIYAPVHNADGVDRATVTLAVLLGPLLTIYATKDLP